MGGTEQKAVWHSGAGKCVMSLDYYNKIPDKFKTQLFNSEITVKAVH